MPPQNVIDTEIQLALQKGINFNQAVEEVATKYGVKPSSLVPPVESVSVAPGAGTVSANIGAGVSKGKPSAGAVAEEIIAPGTSGQSAAPYSPTDVSGEITPWEKARMGLIEYHGKRAAEFDRASIELDEAARKAGFRNMTPEQYTGLLKNQVSEYQRTGQATGPFREFLDVYDRLRSPLEAQILEIKPDWQMRENYFRQIFSDRGDTWKRWVAKNKSSLEGSKGFLREKKYFDWEEGLNAGLTPRYNNIRDLTLADLAQKQQMVAGHQFFRQMKDDGIATFVKLGDRPPSGMKMLEDKRFRASFYSDEIGGIVNRGNYWADGEIASLINTQFEPNLQQQLMEHGSKAMAYLSRAIDVGVKATNITRQVKVAGPFHFWFTDQTYRALANSMASLTEGAVGKAAGSLPESLIPGASLKARQVGKKIQEAFLTPGKYGSEFDEAVNNLIEGGQRFRLDKRGIIRNLFTESDNFGNVFKDAFYDTLADLKGLHLGKVLGRGLDALTAPIMKYHVPQVKLAAHMMLTTPEISALRVKYGVDAKGVAASPELQSLFDTERKFINQRASALVDNAFGMMVKENLMMKPVFKDILSAAIQFPTWNIGTFKIAKNLVAGAGSTANLAANIATGGKIGSPEGMRYAEKMAFRLGTGLLINTGIYGTLLHRTMTGEWPSTLKDAFMPVVDSETGDRLIAGTYLRTYQTWAEHMKQGNPLAIASSMRNNALSAVVDIMNNRTFQNTQIRDPYDPYTTQVKDVTKYGLTQTLDPIIRSQMERGVTPITKYSGLVGYQVPAKALTNTPLEEYIAENTRKTTKTKEEGEALDIKYAALKMFQAKRPEEANALLDKAVTDKKLTETQRYHIESLSEEHPLVNKIKHLSAIDAVRAWPYASKEEKLIIMNEVYGKIDRELDRNENFLDKFGKDIDVILNQMDELAGTQ